MSRLERIRSIRMTRWIIASLKAKALFTSCKLEEEERNL